VIIEVGCDWWLLPTDLPSRCYLYGIIYRVATKEGSEKTCAPFTAQAEVHQVLAALDALPGVEALAALAQLREELRDAERRALVRARHEALRGSGAAETTSWTILARETGCAIPPIRRRVLAAEEALDEDVAAYEEAVATCRASSDPTRILDTYRAWTDHPLAKDRRLDDAFTANAHVPDHIKALARL